MWLKLCFQGNNKASSTFRRCVTAYGRQGSAECIMTAPWAGRPRNCDFIPKRTKSCFSSPKHLNQLWGTSTLLFGVHQGLYPWK